MVWSVSERDDMNRDRQQSRARAAGVGTRLSTACLGAAMWLRGTLPAPLIAPAVDGVATLAWLVMPRTRRILARNLQELTGPQPRTVRRRLVRRAFRNFVRMNSDALALPQASSASILALVHVEGRAYLDRAIADGRGVIIVTAHLGNWELLASVVPALGIPMNGIFESVTPARDRLMAACRTRPGLSVIPGGPGSARLSVRALLRGEVVTTAADRAVGDARAVTVPFGQGHRPIPIGPARMAVRTGASVIPVFLVLSDSGGHPYRLVIEPPIEAPSDAEDAGLAWAHAIGARLGEAAARHPDQWLVFNPEWQATPA
jgi:KDO2-lipid IV(A) lauroyltransferase